MSDNGYDDPRIIHLELKLIEAKLDRIIELLEKQQSGTVVVGAVGLDGKVQFPSASEVNICNCASGFWCPTHSKRTFSMPSEAEPQEDE